MTGGGGGGGGATVRGVKFAKGAYKPRQWRGRKVLDLYIRYKLVALLLLKS